MKTADRRVLCACALAGCAMPLASQARPFSFVNPDLYRYGRIDQKDVRMDPTMPGVMPEFGRWSCGPTALTNSLGYLQRKFDGFYTNGLNQRTLVPGLTNLNPNPTNNPPDDQAALLKVASDLASPAYMDQKKGAPPPNPFDPYRRVSSPSQPNDGTTPQGGDTGGVTWERFAFGKDCWFKPITEGGNQPNKSWLEGQYTRPWDANQAIPKPAWLEDNIAMNPEKMFTMLRKHADVELGFSWSGAAGGHFVTLYGYSLTLDVNGDNKFDPGDTAVLSILDPWGAPVNGIASETTLTMTQAVAGGAMNLMYDPPPMGAAFGAALALPSGVAQMWTSEIPGPGGVGLLAMAGVLAARRRRRVR